MRRSLVVLCPLAYCCRTLPVLLHHRRWRAGSLHTMCRPAGDPQKNTAAEALTDEEVMSCHHSFLSNGDITSTRDWCVPRPTFECPLDCARWQLPPCLPARCLPAPCSKRTASLAPATAAPCRAVNLACLKGVGRSDDALPVYVSDLAAPRPNKVIGEADCLVYRTVLRGGKRTASGEVQWFDWIPAYEPELCPVTAEAAYLVQRFEIQGQPFPNIADDGGLLEL